MMTDPVSAISNPIIGDAATQGGLPPLPGQANARPSRQEGVPAPVVAQNPSPVEGLSGRITAAHRDFPAVNTPLIEFMRALLEQGRGQPDPAVIAQKLLQVDQLLPGAESDGR
jgi:hypothetical protein